jgi:hypothetical protein
MDVCGMDASRYKLGLLSYTLVSFGCNIPDKYHETVLRLPRLPELTNVSSTDECHLGFMMLRQRIHPHPRLWDAELGLGSETLPTMLLFFWASITLW